MTSPAFNYGVALGALHRAMEEFAQQFAAGFEVGWRPLSTTTPRTPEQHSEAIYRIAIARERRVGLDHVRREAQRIRRELGLLTEGPLPVTSPPGPRAVQNERRGP